MISQGQHRSHLLACASLATLLLLCLAWELWLAPLRPGGSWMALKALPLLLPLRGVIKKDNYTMQWTSMLIWLYFIEGVVRSYSDTKPVSIWCAALELGLSLVYFGSVLVYLRPLKRAAKALAKQHG
ncbi:MULTISPECIES: DUF2069 domain-containing protein [unclassified Undibacterium]|uniref:DUF2069 domain-containing protein n=1 Tax=unclassified Undibacterium TaxID=2630295 RepID=UPI002AC932C1|nr:MULTISPECIES: DUF2069 domain-containing protein [unclassified Undibacterium]MEB0138479.1 DUF2069 domain-containing protein [Undibacterium sp. CCC2.1]MEB0173121.1 DUF2069 domain-containing protein [Undibacterium sp. CCC1.1]MEB0177511.1 DUF2069 domain-containing protein [Undibacterium sp. CCC3.4]MEB0216173.1 DUF2069 domain-containing protein [Undibacterium sp. 5I2]WPX42778.1 DUF2069 domain-containing protein [Undibacterium sp. CCC3.4]